MFRLSPLTKKTVHQVFKNKRTFVSLVILFVLYLLSVFSELIACDKPIVIRYNEKLYFFSAFIFYPEKTFGGIRDTEAQYKELAVSAVFTADRGNFMIFPPVPYGPYASNLSELESKPPTRPDERHPLGTDDRGRDVFARLLYGFRVSFNLAFILLCCAIAIGVTVGALRGYIGGFFDLAFGGVIEVLGAMPVISIVILIGSIYGKSFFTLVSVFSVFSWICLASFVRTEVLRVKESSYVDAARSLGVGRCAVFFSEVLPNILAPVFTFAPFFLIGAMSFLTGLDYLGFGLPATTPNWGDLLRQGMEHRSSYWLSVFPSLSLCAVLLLLAFVGRGLREIMNHGEYARLE
ncbi:MAG: ABC transporter permease subunit [Spirochaetales bacterium]|nr:ABC transporter permease subunit [Spirochaetales bacterium]